MFALLMFFALALFPIFDGLWPVFALTLAGAFRIWLRCQGAWPEACLQASCRQNRIFI